MAVSFYYGELVHGVIQNLDSGEYLNFLMNPEQLTTAIKPNYARMNTRGGSHQWLQYSHTDNPKFNLTLVFSRYVYIQQLRMIAPIDTQNFEAVQTGFEAHRNQLLALCYPRGQANDPLRRSPPSALLLWPKHVAVTCQLDSLTLVDRKFDSQQRVTEFNAQCVFESYLQYRLTSREIRQKGLKLTKVV